MLCLSLTTQDGPSPEITFSAPEEDEVSLLSYDASYATIECGSAASGSSRFDSSPGQNSDEVPKQPVRRRPTLTSTCHVTNLDNDSSAAESGAEESMDSKLDGVLGIVDQLGKQLGELKRHNTDCSLLVAELEAQKEIKQLRERLEQKRMARESIEAEKITLKEDICMTTKAQLALKNLVQAWGEDLDVIQDQEKTANAKQSLLELVEKIETIKQRKARSHPDTVGSNGGAFRSAKQRKARPQRRRYGTNETDGLVFVRW